MPRTTQEEESKMYDRKAQKLKAEKLRKWLWKLVKERGRAK